MRHIAAEAERLAEGYADLGADYAGELFNKVMGNQASDGAYFTRPAAASLLARLALDVAASRRGLDRSARHGRAAIESSIWRAVREPSLPHRSLK